MFRKFGIPLANSIVISKNDNIREKVEHFSFPAIVKSQIAIGSRKKAGLIKISQDKNEAILLCNKYFEREVGGFHVEAILIEELADIQHEYYCSIALDASSRQFYLIASKEGGIDIEDVAQNNPGAIIKRTFSYTEGLTNEIAKDVGEKIGFSGELLDSAI